MIEGVRVHYLALRELTDAVLSYREESQTLAQELYEEVSQAFALIREFPRIGPIDAEPLRVYSLRRFPYQIRYEILDGGAIHFVAFGHRRRRPGYWTGR